MFSNERLEDLKVVEQSSKEKPFIIGFVGVKRTGKDTAANYLINKYGFKKYAFIDPLKEACKSIFLLSDEQVYGNEEKESIDDRWGTSPRRILQIVGTELFRKQLLHSCPEMKKCINRGFWVHRFFLWYNDWIKNNPNGKLVINDIRFPNEADALRSLGGLIIRVERTNLDSLKDAEVNLHISEIEVQKVEADFVLKNDGSLQELYSNIENIMNEISSKPA